MAGADGRDGRRAAVPRRSSRTVHGGGILRRARRRRTARFGGSADRRGTGDRDPARRCVRHDRARHRLVHRGRRRRVGSAARRALRAPRGARPRRAFRGARDPGIARAARGRDRRRDRGRRPGGAREGCRHHDQPARPRSGEHAVRPRRQPAGRRREPPRLDVVRRGLAPDCRRGVRPQRPGRDRLRPRAVAAPGRRRGTGAGIRERNVVGALLGRRRRARVLHVSRAAARRIRILSEREAPTAIARGRREPRSLPRRRLPHRAVPGCAHGPRGRDRRLRRRHRARGDRTRGVRQRAARIHVGAEGAVARDHRTRRVLRLRRDPRRGPARAQRDAGRHARGPPRIPSPGRRLRSEAAHRRCDDRHRPRARHRQRHRAREHLQLAAARHRGERADLFGRR